MYSVVSATESKVDGYVTARSSACYYKNVNPLLPDFVSKLETLKV